MLDEEAKIFLSFKWNSWWFGSDTHHNSVKKDFS